MPEIKVQDSILVESSFSSTISTSDNETKSLSSVQVKDVGYILTPGKYCIIPTNINSYDVSMFSANNKIMMFGISAEIMSLDDKVHVRLVNMNNNHSIRVTKGTIVGDVYCDHGERG